MPDDPKAHGPISVGQVTIICAHTTACLGCGRQRPLSDGLCDDCTAALLFRRRRQHPPMGVLC